MPSSDPYGDPSYNLFNATTTTASTTSTTIAVHYPNLLQTPRPLAINPYAAVHQPASVNKVERNSVTGGYDLEVGPEQVSIFGPPMRPEPETTLHGQSGVSGVEAPARAAGTTTQHKGFAANAEKGKREQPKTDPWWTWKQFSEHTKKKPFYSQSLRWREPLIPIT